ncbi:MAG TPA: hypothetical protein VEH58_04350, partial [Dehalococcoidales bacterium]|nr:hypothetical protein [Dehalococcoidales bacterium]
MDNSKKSQNIEFDDEGHVIIPLELAARYGIKKGNPIRLSETPRGLEIISSSRLQKLYIEPTNLCNLDCRTCMRNA